MQCCKAITHWWNWTMWFGKVKASVLVWILLDKSGFIQILIHSKRFNWKEWNSKDRLKFNTTSSKSWNHFWALPPNTLLASIIYWKSEIFCLLDHWSMTGTLLLSHRLKLIIEQTLQIKLMGKWRNYIRIRHQVIS